MTNLEQQHFNAIQPILLKGLRFTQDAAKASEAITIEKMKRFSEWVSIMGYSINLEGFWFNHRDRNILTGNELIQAYLKTLS